MKEKKVINLTLKNTMIIVVSCFLFLFIVYGVIDYLSISKSYKELLASGFNAVDFFKSKLLGLVFSVLMNEYFYLIIIFIIIEIYNRFIENRYIKNNSLEKGSEIRKQFKKRRRGNFYVSIMIIIFGVFFAFAANVFISGYGVSPGTPVVID